MPVCHAGTFGAFACMEGIIFTGTHFSGNHLARDEPGAQDERDAARAVKNGTFDPPLRCPAVQNERDIPRKIIVNMLRRYRRDMLGAVGAGRRHGTTDRAQKRLRRRRGGNADGERRKATRDIRAHNAFGGIYHRERPRKKLFAQTRRPRGRLHKG